MEVGFSEYGRREKPVAVNAVSRDVTYGTSAEIR
jgi:hypothetical protein